MVRWRWPDRRAPLLRSAAGHYIGTQDDEGPVVEYFPNHLAAQRALDTHAGHSALTPDSHPSRSSLMNLSLPEDVLDQMALEQAHFDCTAGLFEAWKRGAQIAGHEWFGDGTREGLQRATTRTCGPTC